MIVLTTALSSVNGTRPMRATTACLLQRQSRRVGRVVMLSKLEEPLIARDERYDLSSTRYPGALHPRGYESLQSFESEPLPVFIYGASDVTLRDACTSRLATEDPCRRHLRQPRDARGMLPCPGIPISRLRGVSSTPSGRWPKRVLTRRALRLSSKLTRGSSRYARTIGTSRTRHRLTNPTPERRGRLPLSDRKGVHNLPPKPGRARQANSTLCTTPSPLRAQRPI